MVASKSSDKTIRVAINTLVKHPQYGKYLRRRTRLAAHDPANEAREGDTVEIAPCRRMSRTKSWRLVKVVRRGSGAEPLPGADKG
jgi:small subunit ribosomal protein S17